MRLFIVLLLAGGLTGCAVMETTWSILDIFYDEPEPVCDSDSVGVTVNGMQCVKFSDGTYRWEKQ